MSNVIKFQSPFEKIKLTNDNPDHMLRMAIILQAIIDSTCIGDTHKDKQIQKEAQEWIFRKDPNFVRMCEESDIEVDHIINITRKVIFFHKAKKLTNNTNEMLDSIKKQITEQIFSQNFDIESVFL